MRQLTCTEPGKLSWLDVPEPRIEDKSDAIVRPLAVARCEIDPFLTAGFIPSRGPFAVGHECVAEIIEPGSDVEGLAAGQQVVVAFQVSCGVCVTCSRGHSGNCDAYPVLSDYGMMPLSGIEYGGMLSDFLRVPHAASMLRPIPSGTDPVNLASASDNVIDGYRSVARHLKNRPGAKVLFACHGTPSIALYGLQAALALGAGGVDFASDNGEVLALAEKLGATPIETDFARRKDRYEVVVDCGSRNDGLEYSLASTASEGVCQSVSLYPTPGTPMPLGKMYTRGIEFYIGRAHAVSLLPEVMTLVEAGSIKPELVTTRIVDWEEAPSAFMEDAIKLVVRR